MSTPALYKNAEFLRAQEELLTRMTQKTLIALRQDLSDLVRDWPFDAVSTGRQVARYDAMMARADVLIREAYVELNARVRMELAALGKRQGLHAAEQLAAMAKLDTVTLALPTKGMMHSILATNPIEGQVMRSWWNDQANSTRKAFRTQMRIGLARQETPAQLIARVRGTRNAEGRYTGGIMNASARGAEALVRTSVNEIANQAALALYRSDPEVSEEFEFVATLDDRTTEECQEADGKVFRYDDPGALIPPLHWNCRSTIIPVIKYKELGLTPPDTERMTYDEWKATQ